MIPYFELTEHDNDFYFNTKYTLAKDSILLFKGSECIVPKEHIFTVPDDEEFIHIRYSTAAIHSLGSLDKQ